MLFVFHCIYIYLYSRRHLSRCKHCSKGPRSNQLADYSKHFGVRIHQKRSSTTDSAFIGCVALGKSQRPHQQRAGNSKKWEFPCLLSEKLFWAGHCCFLTLFICRLGVCWGWKTCEQRTGWQRASDEVQGFQMLTSLSSGAGQASKSRVELLGQRMSIVFLYSESCSLKRWWTSFPKNHLAQVWILVYLWNKEGEARVSSEKGTKLLQIFPDSSQTLEGLC